jgi:hypothetical protein
MHIVLLPNYDREEWFFGVTKNKNPCHFETLTNWTVMIHNNYTVLFASNDSFCVFHDENNTIANFVGSQTTPFLQNIDASLSVGSSTFASIISIQNL